jgi:parallel beta-helix repeat protein
VGGQKVERLKFAALSGSLLLSVSLLAVGIGTIQVQGILTSHDPISINGDNQFTSPNGVTSGSGTQSNPYIIENWVINASSADGISIVNTTKSFAIRNCSVENGYNNNYDGIYLSNVVNAVVESNTCENDANGIHLVSSSNDNVIGNTFSQDNLYGADIWLDSSSNIIVYCNVTNDGIELNGSSYGDIDSNICDNTGAGISLENSNYNTLTNNTCENNFQYGIYLYSSSNNNLINNTCENNFEGIDLDNFSDNNMIENNVMSGNGDAGIVLYVSADYNIVVGNNSSGNYAEGITVWYCAYDNLISNVTDNSEVNPGISMVSDNYCVVSGNTSNNNYLSGIFLENSCNCNILTNNNCENNNYGIYLRDSDNNRIYHNNFIINSTQAHDNGANYWDNGYPSGGNYWSDYAGFDNYRGENQDVPGADGIGDKSYKISGGNNQDRYPLMNPLVPFVPILIPLSPKEVPTRWTIIIGIIVVALVIGITAALYVKRRRTEKVRKRARRKRCVGSRK